MACRSRSVRGRSGSARRAPRALTRPSCRATPWPCSTSATPAPRACSGTRASSSTSSVSCARPPAARCCPGSTGRSRPRPCSPSSIARRCAGSPAARRCSARTTSSASAAYPDRSFVELSFADAARAIAAYEREAFSFPEAAWDAYLRGELEAISDAAKLGAILFYGRAGCGACHTGPLLSDQRPHATGVPQLGPGAPASAPYDHGRELVSGDPGDHFAFRTPSLRNVEVSAPYMHDGALVSFEKVLFHYGSPTTSIPDFDASVLLPELADTVLDDADHVADMVASLSPELELEPNFVGLSNIREFLLTLTDPAVFELRVIL